MKFNNIFVAIAFLLAMALPISGCAKPSGNGGSTSDNGPSPVVVASLINIGTSSAVNLGLEQWSKKDAGIAKTTANDIHSVVSEVVLPYLNNNTGLSSAAINTLLKDKIVNLPNMPMDVQNAIVLAATLLDSYLPAPSATTYLNPDQISYIKAFLTGLDSGCQQYLAGIPPPPAPKLNKGIRMAKVGWLK